MINTYHKDMLLYDADCTMMVHITKTCLLYDGTYHKDTFAL